MGYQAGPVPKDELPRAYYAAPMSTYLDGRAITFPAYQSIYSGERCGYCGCKQGDEQNRDGKCRSCGAPL